MKRKLLLVVFILVLSILTGIAQTREITGKVTSSDDGAPIPGVSVVLKGTTVGVITDANGIYSIKVPDSSQKLAFSFVGMKTQEIVVDNQKIINIKMLPENIAVEEVMVVAYGTAKKSSFTGSAVAVKGEELAKAPSASFVSALQGSTSGVQVLSMSGQPGSQNTVRIRGVGSISGLSSPLYVIDGIAISSENYSWVAESTYNGTTTSPLNSINPADIESVTILKDASAAALYGSRAANGVVLITTKQGKAGKTKIDFSARYGITDMAVKQHELMNAPDYYKTYFDYYYNQNLGSGKSGEDAAKAANTSTLKAFGNVANPYNTNQPYGSDGKLKSDARLLYDTNWRDLVFRLGNTQEYFLSLTGGSDKSKFYLSAGYDDQKGILIGSDFNRFSTKMNVSSSVNEFLTVGMSNMLSLSMQNTPTGGGQGSSAVNFSQNVASVFPLHVWKNGVETSEYFWNNPVQLDFNPVALVDMDKYQTKNVRGIVSGFAEIKFLKDFSFKTQLSYDYNEMREREFANPSHGNGVSVNGRANRYNILETSKSMTNTLNWSKEFGDHSVSVLLGQEASKNVYEFIQTEATNFVFPGTEELIAASKPTTTDSYIREKALSSYLSRINYDYMEKYYASASLRRDGSSIFGKNNRWGNFWSIAGSWRISKENFMAGLPWLNDLRLRASYGINGNDAVNIDERYIAMGLFDFGRNYAGYGGISFLQMANPNLRWEKLSAYDLAVEFRVFDRLSGTIAYYNRTSDGLLYDQPLSYTTGVTSVKTNLSEIENSGWEFDLSNENIRTNNFTWITGLSFSLNKNKILSLPQDNVVDRTKIWSVGYDRYQYYLKEFAGIDPADGSPTWYLAPDQNGNRKTTKSYSAAPKFKAGSSLPKVTGSLKNSFTYKGINLSFMFYGSFGGYMLDYEIADLMHMGLNNGSQLSKKVIDGAWKKPGDKTDITYFKPSNSTNFNQVSTRWLFKNSFVRLRNVSLSYNLPKSIIERMKIDNMNVFIQGDNLWTWQTHKGIDPEQNINGDTNTNLPNIKVVSIGVKLSL